MNDIMQVIDLGVKPIIGDCSMILHVAVRAPLPSAFSKILQTTQVVFIRAIVVVS